MESPTIPTGNKKRPTIGFLVDWAGGRYQSQVWPGAVAAAEERDANLIMFSGRSLRAPHGYLIQSNAVYDAISTENIDGMVVLSGTIFNYVTQDEFRLFISRFYPLPVVSISIDLENHPSVLIDNRDGIRLVMSHLIETHGYKRIAFVCGPDVNEEALQRFASYRDELTQHGLPFDPLLVAPGNFSEEAGRQAVRLFLDERHIRPDAIVAVDDDTALGVLKELRLYGLSVPDDIAVVGFDDIDEAGFSSPPLTTVHQPFFAQSHLAVSLLLDHLDGKPIPQITQMNMQLAVRQSCGCMAETVNLAGAPVCRVQDSVPSETSDRQMIKDVREAIEQNYFHRSDAEKALEWATQLVDGFIADLGNAETSHFVRKFDRILQDAIAQYDEIGKWQNVISALRNAWWVYYPEQTGNRRAEDLLGQARVLIGETMERVQGEQLLQYYNHSLDESEVNRSVLATLEYDELRSIVMETLSMLGITSGYIALSEAQSYNPSRLFLAFNETGVLTNEISTEYNPLVSLVPVEFLPQSRRYTMIMEALYFQSEPLGFALFELNPQRGGILYSELRQQLSSALKGASLLMQHKQAEQELKSINRELEVFSYSVSHDLKAPLRAISQLSGWIVEDYADVLDTAGKEKLNLLVERTKHMHNLIDSVLQYSRVGRVTEKAVKVNLDKKVREIIDILVPPDTIHITIQGTLPVVIGEQTYITQVFQNILSNAVYYMDKPEGYIRVTCKKQKDDWLFSIADNGPGIDEKYFEKIFEMFQTLGTRKGSESTGVGLSLVKRIVEKWGGKIWVASEIGRGSTFFFTMPKS